MLEWSVLEQFQNVELLQYFLWSAFQAEGKKANNHIEGELPPELDSQWPNGLVLAD